MSNETLFDADDKVKGEEKKQYPLLKLLIFVSILSIASFFRLYHIDRLPPGVWYDPAWYGVDALEILAGKLPIFLPTNFGREVLFSYITALTVWLFGAVPLSIHIASAIVGILTIPAIYWVAKELFAEEEGVLGDYGALLAAFVLAVSYWHLSWSRFGVRAILLPLFSCLAFYYLLRAFRTELRWNYVLTGVLLGLSAYTYQAARIMPLVVIAGFIIHITHKARSGKDDVWNFMIVVGTSVIVFAPLGSYFLTHPGSFSERINQTWAVNQEQGIGSNLQVMLERFVGYFLILLRTGENEIIYYLLGRPILDIFAAILFLLGMGIGLWRIKRPNYQFIFAWLLIMIVPAILAVGQTTKRAIGSLPVVVLFIVLGALAPWRGLNHWARKRDTRVAHVLKYVGQGAIVLTLVASSIFTFYDYFVVWGDDQDLYTHLETPLSEIGQYTTTLSEDEPVYISPVPVEHPSIVFGSKRRGGLKRYNGRVCMVTPTETQSDITYIILPGEQDDPFSLEMLATYFPDGEISANGSLHYGQPSFLAYRVPAGMQSQMTPSTSALANWENYIRLLGYDFDRSTYQPGDTIYLTLYYEALGDIDADYTAFVQLLGEFNPASNGPLWAGYDSQPCQQFYPTSTWAPGEIVREQITFHIPPETPAGMYELHTGFYLWPSLERLSLMKETGGVIGNSYMLVHVEIGE